MEGYLIKALNASIQVIINENKDNNYGDWEKRSFGELNKIIDSDYSIIKDKIENFIAGSVYVSDSPTASIKGYSNNKKWFLLLMRLATILTAQKRGAVKEAKLTYQMLVQNRAINLLDKYPMPNAGRPFKVYHKDYSFTNRYLRHIYFLSVAKKHLMSSLGSNFITMDIGSSYGIFQSLIKKEASNSKHILVDIPGQLVLAHYYLQTVFPNANIAGINETSRQESIDGEYINKYDFILISASQYDKLTVTNIDLVTNFVSFVEMPKEWFDIYINSQPFLSAKYFYTVNRYDSCPTYTSGTTIIDFPINKYKKILFGTLPILRYYFPTKWFFFTKKQRYHSELFQFIGINKNHIE